MDNYKRNKREGVRVQEAIANRQILTELSCDFSLPDYQPEVKRLLRVRATATPPDKYIGAGSAEFSGRVDYSILYAGSDGALYCANHTEDYSFSCPLEMTSDFELNEGLVCDVDTVPESAVGRVAAPRKLSLKCRLRSHVCILGTRLIEESMTGENAGGIQRLYGNSECAMRFVGVGSPMQLGDEILYEGSDLRVICADGRVFISEAVAGSGVVNCRGEVCLKLLCVHEGDGEGPTVQWRRIPFSQSVPTDGAEVNCEATATGICSALNITVEEGRMLCEVSVILHTHAQRNESISFTRDIYSTEAECESKYLSVKLPQALKCVSGNFSLNQTLTLEEAGIKSGMHVVDLHLIPAVNDLTVEKGKYSLSGRCRAQAVLSDGEEYAVQEFELPLRYACDGSDREVTDYDSNIEVISCRARVDGERIAVDAELSVTVAARGACEVEMLSEVSFGNAVTRTCAGYTVCYPAREDTLWSIAKRYHRAVAAVSDANSLPAAAAADARESLSGVRYLLV